MSAYLVFVVSGLVVVGLVVGLVVFRFWSGSRERSRPGVRLPDLEAVEDAGFVVSSGRVRVPRGGDGRVPVCELVKADVDGVDVFDEGFFDAAGGKERVRVSHSLPVLFASRRSRERVEDKDFDGLLEEL